MRIIRRDSSGVYEIDKHVALSILKDVPPSSGKAPCPIMLSDEQMLVLAYYLEVEGGKRSEFGGANAGRGPIPIAKAAWAVVEFQDFRAVTMGGPFGPEQHPLAAKGLERYGAYEVERSTWIRGNEELEQFRHFVFSFHESTFECVAKGYRLSFHEGPLRRVLGYMQQRLIS